MINNQDKEFCKQLFASSSFVFQPSSDLVEVMNEYCQLFLDKGETLTDVQRLDAIFFLYVAEQRFGIETEHDYDEKEGLFMVIFDHKEDCSPVYEFFKEVGFEFLSAPAEQYLRSDTLKYLEMCNFKSAETLTDVASQSRKTWGFEFYARFRN